MKNIIKKTLGYTLIYIAMALIMVMITDKISADFYIPYQGTVILLCLVAICAITGTALLASILSKREHKANMMHTILGVVFMSYIIALLKVLFIDRTDLSSASIIYHKDMRDINLVPFDTIKLFIRSWNYGYLRKGVVITNLIGNIVIFLPMVVFLWCLFKPMRKNIVVIIVSFIIIVGVEICQYLTGFGSCDVDDVILNMIGVILGYIIVRFKWFKKICHKLYIIDEKNS